MDVDPKDIARNIPEDPDAPVESYGKYGKPADDWVDEFGPPFMTGTILLARGQMPF